MAARSGFEQVSAIITSLSDGDIERLAKLVRRERKRRGLLPGKTREADQGQSNRGGRAR